MTREQRLFSSSKLFDEFLNFSELMRGGLFKEETREFRAAIAEAYNDWQACLNETIKHGQSYEGVPFSDGQEQDISPDAPHYNPKISGRM